MYTINITASCFDCKTLRVSLDDVQQISVPGTTGTDLREKSITKPPGTYHLSWTANSNSKESIIEVYLELIPNCEVTWNPTTPSWEETIKDNSRIYGLPKSQRRFKGAGQKISGKVEFTF